MTPRLPSKLRLAVLAAACALALGCSDGGGGGGNKIKMKDDFFEPKDVTVAIGAPVTLEYENSGSSVHNLQIASGVEGRPFGSAALVRPGEKGSIEVNYGAPGEYAMLCTFHPGMTGTLTAR